ncbi:hypothetical protein [Scytonema sp. UIC 10036]|uniref:hypothetical protein n=1 Tax=Scytonema sp. UIC 10036 TaxID=2304196 RepID=UPI001A9B3C94|nr:hypothetical protein [Scytonema sp. UIC 10036]
MAVNHAMAVHQQSDRFGASRTRLIAFKLLYKGAKSCCEYKVKIGVEVTTMLNLTLTNSQIVELVKQLPQEQQIEVFKFLLNQNWANWLYLSHDSEERVRKVATQRGRDWNVMTEDEREEFTEEVLHE